VIGNHMDKVIQEVVIFARNRGPNQQ